MLRRGDHIYVTAPVTVLSYLMKRLGITQKKIRTPCSSGQRRQHGRRSQGLPCFAPDEEHSPHTIRKALHPRRVQPVYMDGRAVSEEVCDNVNAYLAIYCVILVLSFAIISVDGFSIGTHFSAVASCFNNIGPGFELVGATQNFSIYSDLSKIILSLDMLLGRLEIFSLLLLLSPNTWSRRR